MLQLVWQGESIPTINRSDYETETEERLKSASDYVSQKIEEMLNQACISNRSDIIGVLYGGPLESEALNKYLKNDVEAKSLISYENLVSINSKLTSSYKKTVNLRRDALVAMGASLFGAYGETLPEFEYEISLRDSFGQISSTLRLIKGKNLSGIQVVTPPYSGVDYFVDINQIRIVNGIRQKTSISGELKLFVRKGAVLMYRISESGVGYATIEASEVQDLPAPEPFVDSRIELLSLPEKSTIFHIQGN